MESSELVLVETIFRRVGKNGGTSILLTAKDFNQILKAAEIAANVIPITKNLHVVHHQNLGGAA